MLLALDLQEHINNQLCTLTRGMPVDRSETTQPDVDAMFKRTDAKPAPGRILDYAKRGLEAPESLVYQEIQQVCYALIAHYEAMGIR